MSDDGEMWREIHEHRRSLKALYGKPCPECQRLLPKTNPSMLLPGQRCRIHGYRDPRKRTKENSFFPPDTERNEP